MMTVVGGKIELGKSKIFEILKFFSEPILKSFIDNNERKKVKLLLGSGDVLCKCIIGQDYTV